MIFKNHILFTRCLVYVCLCIWIGWPTLASFHTDKNRVPLNWRENKLATISFTFWKFTFILCAVMHIWLLLSKRQQKNTYNHAMKVVENMQKSVYIYIYRLFIHFFVRRLAFFSLGAQSNFLDCASFHWWWITMISWTNRQEESRKTKTPVDTHICKKKKKK